MVARLNEILKPAGVSIDFDTDVIPLSKFFEGGSITERHVLLCSVEKVDCISGKRSETG